MGGFVTSANRSRVLSTSATDGSVRRALLSVSDKNKVTSCTKSTPKADLCDIDPGKVVELGIFLASHGVEVLSTGGTAT